MTQTDLDTNDGIVQSMLKVFNIAYPDWTIDGENREVVSSDVDFRTGLKKCYAKFGARESGTLLFTVQKQQWVSKSVEWDLMLLIHEISHAKSPGRGDHRQQPGHPPLFWEWVAKNFNRIFEKQDEIENFFGEIDWNEVRRQMVSDVTMKCVDLRSEDPYQRRKKLAQEIQYAGEVMPFEGIRLYKNPHVKDSDAAEIVGSDSTHGGRVTTVKYREIETDPLPLEAVEDWWNGRNRDCLQYDSSETCYYIEPIVLESCNGPDKKYQIKLGREVYSLYYHARKNQRSPDKLSIYAHVIPSSH